jgi:hypothetical protein
MAITILDKGQSGVINQLNFLNGNTTASPMPKTACWYPIVSLINGTGPIVHGSASQDFLWIPGQVCPITSVDDNGSGKARFYFAAGHPFVTGNQAAIASSISTYNGNIVVTYIDSTHFDISASYAGSASGNVYMGDRLKCLMAANYYPYYLSYSAYVKGGAACNVYTAMAISTSVPWLANKTTACADGVTYYRVSSGRISTNIANLEIQLAYACTITTAPTFASFILNIEPDFDTVAP